MSRAPEPPDSAEPDRPDIPLLELDAALPPVVETPEALDDLIDRFAAGSGPFAIDAERASGYRYSHRAYLIQIRRRGAGTALIDPVPFGDVPNTVFEPLATAIGATEWIIHAASQDLACLAEVGLRPTMLFDTELAGRLLNYPRVGLAALVEELLGFRMRKEHSAADWSKRPLPESWLLYAALDVELLIELGMCWLSISTRRASASGPTRSSPPGQPQTQPRRAASLGGGRLASTASAAGGGSPWCGRCGSCATTSPGAATSRRTGSCPTRRSSRPRRRRRSRGPRLAGCRPSPPGARSGTSASSTRRSPSPGTCPRRSCRRSRPSTTGRRPRGCGPRRTPWQQRVCAAAADVVAAIATEANLPQENLIAPDPVRRLAWDPPDPASVATVAAALAGMAARPWQIALVAEPLAAALVE